MSSFAVTLGTPVRCYGTFRDLAGAYEDPATVKFYFAKPDGTETTYTYGVGVNIVKTDVGRYYVDLPTTLAGIYSVRWEGVGAAVDEDFFKVLALTF